MIGPLESQPMVFVIDDDPSVCKALSNVFRSVGLGVDVLGSTTQLLERRIPDVASCLVLDVGLPNLSGLDFQVELAKANIDIPVVFMAGHSDIPTTVRAMKAGAVDFLIKPFRDQDMLDAVATAIERDRKRCNHETVVSNLQARFETLASRERDVLALVATGHSNKQIAAQLCLVRVDRGRIMKKMGAKSVADLVRMAQMLGVRCCANSVHVETQV